MPTADKAVDTADLSVDPSTKPVLPPLGGVCSYARCSFFAVFDALWLMLVLLQDTQYGACANIFHCL
jgi:hypothetical protein